MRSTIESKLHDLREICRRRRVRRLALFGSAAKNQFDPSSSDLDFLVEFQPMTPREHADSYFGALQDLEHLFGVPIDLIEPGPITNPYFKQEVEATQAVLFEVA
jgi:hypothetical protein